MPNRCIVGGCYRTSRPRDRTASFHQFPIPSRKSTVGVNGYSSWEGGRPRVRTASFHQFPISSRKSTVVNGYSSFNIISSTSGADDEDDEEVVLGAGAYRFQLDSKLQSTHDSSSMYAVTQILCRARLPHL